MVFYESRLQIDSTNRFYDKFILDDKTKWMIKSKKVPLMMIILPSEVDDDG